MDSNAVKLRELSRQLDLTLIEISRQTEVPYRSIQDLFNPKHKVSSLSILLVKWLEARLEIMQMHEKLAAYKYDKKCKDYILYGQFTK